MSVRPSPRAAPPPGPGVLYDARRDVHFTKPVLRGWLHLLWFCVSLVAGTVLLLKAHGPARVTAAAIYVTSVSALFGASALYHRGSWSVAWRHRLQRLDQLMIIVLIAGTATPPFLLAVPGGLGVAGVAAVWTLALAAATLRMVKMNAPERLVGGIYLGLGWAAALALPSVWIHAGAVAGALLLGGGLLYTAGAVFFHRRRPDPYPSVFGFHEVFHTWVCAAATCQFAALALLIR
jgi:hemolysin III